MVRIVLRCAVIALAAMSAVASEIKIATEYPDGNSVLQELRNAGERIANATDNRVTLKLYPGGVMGDGVSVQRKIRIGQLQGAFIHSGALAATYPDSQVLNAPLLFRDFNEVDAVRSQFDAELVEGFRGTGWRTFGLVEGGFAYAMTQVPVTDLDTLRQQKLWLPANDPFSAKIAKAFGINPIALNISDVLTALQTGAINALVAPPVGAITLQWYSRVDYLTDAPFMYTYGVIALSERAMRGLSEDDQVVVARELTVATQNLDKQARQDNLKAFDALSQLGLEITSLDTDARRQIEQEAAKAVSLLIDSGEFDGDLYQRVMAVLKQVRQSQ